MLKVVAVLSAACRPFRSGSHRPAASPMDLHQGDCIQLGIQLDLQLDSDLGSNPEAGDPDRDLRTYQVIGVDAGRDRCWLRSWPLARHGSPVFEMSLAQVHRQGHRCSPPLRRH